MIGEIQRTEFLGVEMDNLSIDEALDQIAILARGRNFSYVVTPNVDHIVILFPSGPGPTTTLFQSAYQAATLRLCDSRVLGLLARFSGKKLQVSPGSDLTAEFFAHGLVSKDKVAIIGANENIIRKLAICCPGPFYFHHIPPMGMLEKPEAMHKAVEFIANADADYVLFAVGAPQSEILAHQCLKSGKCRGVGLCIGASIEFITSDKSRAPKWMQIASLEWLYRLLSEPSRLWRRYLIEGPKILKIWWKQERSR